MMTFFCWVFLYLILYRVAAAFSMPLWVTAAVTVVYTVCLAIWLCRKGVGSDRLTVRAWIAALPLLVFAFANVVFLQRFAVDVAWMCVMVGAVAEELLFRGLLFSALEKKNKHLAVWASTIVFSAYHWISGGVLQALCALCFGFALAAYICRFRSLLPCIAAHLLTNAFGSSTVPMWFLVLCCVMCCIYGCVLYLKSERRKENGIYS